MGYFVAKLTKIQGFWNWNNFATQLIYISFCGFRIPYLGHELMDCIEGSDFWGLILNQPKIAASAFFFVAP
jgi:hypothetical protein